MAGLRPLRSVYVEAALLWRKGGGAIEGGFGDPWFDCVEGSLARFLTNPIGVNLCDTGTHLHTALSAHACGVC